MPPPSPSPAGVNEQTIAEIQTALLEWFAIAQRDLPWRRTTDPYAVWVSEMMLQQTQVATVIPYYLSWMERFPTVEALAAAGEHDVLHAWQGLGYYSRARNLLRGAREVVRHYNGRVPADPDQLRKLPGIGPYTAGAIASIAYNRPAPIVDGNIIRVLTRLFALRGDPAKAPLKKRIWELAECLIPEGRAREFNPAMMELGATVCTPARPACGGCPLQALCEARRLGIQQSLPETPARPPITPVGMAAALLRRGDELLLVQRRSDEARWAGMWQFPAVELLPGEASETGAARAVREAVGIECRVVSRAAVVRHSVTRFRITLEAFHCRPASGEPTTRGCQDWRWVHASLLGSYALPQAHRKLAERLNGESPHGQPELALGD